jgi:molybdate transport system regulatory protein
MLAPGVPLGPGKADLLEAIRQTGSMAAAARELGMSYQRAHDLVATMNAQFTAPLVAPAKGGARGGGSMLTALGEAVLARYLEIVDTAETATARQRAWLARQLRR